MKRSGEETVCSCLTAAAPFGDERPEQQENAHSPVDYTTEPDVVFRLAPHVMRIRVKAGHIDGAALPP